MFKQKTIYRLTLTFILFFGIITLKAQSHFLNLQAYKAQSYLTYLSSEEHRNLPLQMREPMLLKLPIIKSNGHQNYIKFNFTEDR